MIAKLTDITAESTAITSFHLMASRPVDYIAGQFIEVTLPHADPDDRGIRRWFTLSSSPTQPEITVTVRCGGSKSSFKRALQRLQPGDEVQISDPLGDFVLPLDGNLPMVWIAGGIGITPFRSMARWLADTNDKREVLLFHSIHGREEAVFADTMQQAGIIEHYLTDTATSTQNRLSAKDILGRIKDPSRPYYYISGPEQMVEALATDLQASGINRQRIVSDVFLGYR